MITQRLDDRDQFAADMERLDDEAVNKYAPLEAYIIQNKAGELLLFTIRHREADTVLAFAHFKKQEWPELRTEGYRTARVTIKEDA